ncbi:YDG domain-containing protein [Paenibacillus sinopodophylli]|uniref:YDG domain-containing protein n=1 Tax=Paenibacillus sinopodophylli TaxID=1837342 RepID=UPI00110CD2CA|nr:YDG domain-containing protein [Paenibacillus sinopodophylli]
MNYTKKFVSTLLITVMLLPSTQAAFGASETSKTDIQGTWAESQVSDWIDKGYVTGYEDGSFKPNNTISRAEFIALINRSYGFTETADVSFSDVASSSWIYTEVSKAMKAGYIKGYADGTFGATKPISRQEAAVIVNRLLNLTNTDSKEANFTDSSSIASWAKEAVDAAAANGVIQGYANNTDFKPHQPLTRAEAVVVLYRSVTVRETLGSTPTPTPTPTATPTATPIATPIATPPATSTPAPTATPIDTTAPTLSGVTVGSISLGDDVNGLSNENGYLYLVPSTTVATLTGLNQAVDASIGTKLSAEAGVNATIKTVGLGLGHYVVYAVDASNNISIASGEIVISKKQLTVANPATLTAVKMYDGTNSTSVTAGSLIDVVGDDSVTVNAVASYNDAAVGTGKTVTVVYTLSGADAGNYMAPVNYTTNTAAITPAQLTIEDPELSLSESEAGDSVVSAVAGGLVGIVANEDVTVSVEVTYDTSAIVHARPLTVKYTISGSDRANYLAPTDNTNYMAYVQYHEDTGMMIDLIKTSKVYDGTKSSVVLAGSRVGSCEYVGICPGDDATVLGLGVYSDENVGTNKTIDVSYTVVGADSINYGAPAPIAVTTGVITARQLSISSPTVIAKVYDGNATAIVIPGTLINVVSGDDVTVHAVATYNNAEVGTHKQIIIVYTLTGEDAGNYLAPASTKFDNGEIIAGV